MALFKKKPTSNITEELVARIWDLHGEVRQLADRLDVDLDQLKKRYQRAEQAERRYDKKVRESPCEDDAVELTATGASRALAYRQDSNNDAR